MGGIGYQSTASDGGEGKGDAREGGRKGGTQTAAAATAEAAADEVGAAQHKQPSPKLGCYRQQHSKP